MRLNDIINTLYDKKKNHVSLTLRLISLLLLQVHILKEEKSDVGRGFLKTKSESVTLNLWCFSPGFSMQSLAKLGAR